MSFVLTLQCSSRAAERVLPPSGGDTAPLPSPQVLLPVACPPSLEFSSSFQQVPHTAFHPSGAASGGVLDPIFAIAVLPALLGGIPELEAQVLCTILQSPVDKLLGDGFDLLLQILCVGMLLLDLLDLYHLLSGEAEAVQGSGPIRSRRRHRLRRTGSHQLIESVLGEAVHKGNNGAATFD